MVTYVGEGHIHVVYFIVYEQLTCVDVAGHGELIGEGERLKLQLHAHTDVVAVLVEGGAKGARLAGLEGVADSPGRLDRHHPHPVSRLHQGTVPAHQLTHHVHLQENMEISW